MTGSEQARAVTIRLADAQAGDAAGLADLLLDVVADGASVGFMNTLQRPQALEFCERALQSAARGERLLWVAEDAQSGALLGTVTLVWAAPDNQRHRADVAKMQVATSARRRGIGKRLLEVAERAAREAGRTLLVLDTVTGSDAERLYARMGWKRCGVIPGYALWPDGTRCDTTVFYRQLEPLGT